jgi:hypothetical protein
MPERGPAPGRRCAARTAPTSSWSQRVTGTQLGRQGVLPVRLPALLPCPELRRHRPGRQPPTSLGSGEPLISREDDIGMCLPHCFGRPADHAE